MTQDVPPVDPLPSTSVVPMGAGVSSVELPSRFTVAKGPGTYELSWRWREQVPFWRFFGLSAALFLFQLPNLMRGHSYTLALLALWAAGIGYTALAWGKNRVTLRLERGALTTRNRPVPMPSRTLEIEEIDRFVARPPPSRAVSWSVQLVRGGTSRHPLVVGAVLTEEQAKLIADELNAAAHERYGALPPGESR